MPAIGLAFVRQLFLILALATLVLSARPSPAADLAPVPNPSFDKGPAAPGDAPQGWKWILQGNAKGTWESEGHTGKCIALENIGHDDQAIIASDKFPVEPNQNYRLTFWHRSRDPIGRMAEVWVSFGENNANAGCRNFTVTTTREWQQRVVEFTTPNIRESFLWFILFARSENSKFYVDDIQLEKLGPAKVTPATIKWTMENTTVEKSMGGIFTKVDGPKTTRPITTVLPLTALNVVNTAAPQTPVVDGLIGDWEYLPWASSIGPLRALSDGGPTEDKTYAYVACDDKKLYIAWKATYRGDAPPASTKPAERDGHVNVDDSVEVLFVPPGGPWIHLIGNSVGALYDDKEGDFNWNGNWEYKTSIRPGEWHGELAIAWADLGLAGPPADGSEWLFDVCRSSSTYAEQCKWCWLNGVGGFVSKQFMGKLRFDSKGWGFCLKPLTAHVGENVGMLYVPMSRFGGGSLVWGLRVLDESGKVICRKSDILTPRKGDLYEHGVIYDLPGQAVYTFSMSVQDPRTGEELFQLTVPLKAQPDMEVNAEVLPFQKRVIVDADSSRTGQPDDPKGKLHLSLLNGGKPVMTADIPRTAAHLFKGEFSIRDCAPGTYTLRAEVVGADGKSRASAEQELIIPPQPEWFGNNLGKTEAVLPPFLPVKADGLKVSVWNRVYEFGPSGLPSQIQSAGEVLLAEPASVQLVSQGKAIPVALPGKAHLLSCTATKAVVESLPAGAGPTFAATTTVEYDGLMKIDFVLDPGATPLDLDRFTLRFPFKQERALYADAPVTAPPFHHVIDKEGWRLDRSFTEGTGEVNGRFWLGDDDRGIDFSFLSDQGWRPYDRPDAVQIERKGGRVTVDFHILGKVRLDKPVRGTLLVTATPLRPFPKEARHWNTIRLDQRLMTVVDGVDSYASDTLKTYAELGTTVFMISDYWSNGYGRPEPFDPKNFAKLVKTAKGLGMKVVIYIGIGAWAERCAETPYMAEWKYVPAMRCTSGRPDQAFTTACLTRANGGQDCLIYLLDRMIRDYDIDGVYVDGSGWSPNANMDIGFGYVDESGKVRPTSTILEIRELFKRIDALFVAHGKTPFIDHHCSWMLAAPVDSFATTHLTGEYMAYRANDNTTFPEEWSRIENTGIQLGLPVEVLCYYGAAWQRYIANTFVYGSAPAATLSSLAGSGNMAIVRAVSPTWKAFLAYDVAGAEWVPFWKAGAAVQSENPAHKLSYYRHPKEGLLLLLANISKDPGIAKVRLDLKKMGFARKEAVVKVVNKNQQAFEFKEGLLTMPLAADDFIMLRVTSEP